MKNSKLRRVLTLMACAVLLVCLSVGATLAYLTSTTNIVENTFSVGNVNFDDEMNGGLDEADVNEYGEPINAAGQTKEEYEEANKDNEEAPAWTPAPRVDENEYKLIPDRTYTKDPTAYIAEGSEPCYVFVNVVNGMEEYLIEDCIHDQMVELGWVQIEDTTVYYKNEVVDAREEMKALVIFETITLKADLDEDDLTAAASQTITIQAYAVQEEGFTSALDAWSKAEATWGEPESDENTGA